MILKHNKKLEEGDARYRYVERIFLENEMGERVLVPSTKPSVGRAFARHLAEGGQYNDERWKHICEITEDIKKLGGFVRATRNNQFNESVQRIVTEATTHYQTLRETMKRLASGRGYNTYFESWTPTLMEDQDTDSLTELFKHSTLDTRIESAIPVLSRLNIAITENTDIDMFEAWADNIIDEALIPRQPDQRDALIDLLGPDSDFMPLGPDGSSAIGELAGILEDDELNDRLAKAAHRDPNRDAKLADARDHFQREGVPFVESVEIDTEVNYLARLRDRIVNQGMYALIEDRQIREADAVGGRAKCFEHIEDLVFRKGTRGVDEARKIL
jgi:hypothetical protein